MEWPLDKFIFFRNFGKALFSGSMGGSLEFPDFRSKKSFEVRNPNIDEENSLGKRKQPGLNPK